MKQDDQKLIRNLSILGAIFVIVFGTLLHFCYGWSGNNFIVGLLAPVNESPWEHMKLAFTPIILFGFIDYYYLRGKANNLCFALVKEIGVSIVFILAVFYIYTGIIGHSILAIDISSFVVGIILAKWLGYQILIGKFKRWEFKGLNIICGLLLIIIASFFIIATIDPPKVNLFQDPVDGSYGINSPM